MKIRNEIEVKPGVNGKALQLLHFFLMLLLVSNCPNVVECNNEVPVSLSATSTSLVLQNGFLLVSFNLAEPQLDLFQAHFEGKSQYGPNLFAQVNPTLKAQFNLFFM